MNNEVYHILTQARRNRSRILAVLLDPDSWVPESVPLLAERIDDSGAQLVFVGGSLMLTNHLDAFVREVKKHTRLPVVLFPGNSVQISSHADAILFLSLISGRNPEFLIGQQVVAAPLLQHSGLEIIPTGYLLIDGGNETTASYISGTKPIPRDKTGIAYATALAGFMMGHRVLYMDAGSGAGMPVPVGMIRKIATDIHVPLIVGGGIRTPGQLEEVYRAGATVAVIGTAFEEDPSVLADYRHIVNKH